MQHPEYNEGFPIVVVLFFFVTWVVCSACSAASADPQVATDRCAMGLLGFTPPHLELCTAPSTTRKIRGSEPNDS